MEKFNESVKNIIVLTNFFKNYNFKYLISKLDRKKYFLDYDMEGISNYAFPIILNTESINLRNKFEKYLTKNGIEFRRGNAGGGNQLRQPYLKSIIGKIDLRKFKEVDHIHFFGYYIGNYPSLKPKKILKVCSIINSVKF